MNHEELPKFHETFNPILDILSNVEIIPYRELIKKVIDNYYSDLPRELLDLKTQSGESLLSNRIGWGKSYLKKGGYIIYPKRGMVQITEKGQIARKSKILLKDVGESSFIDFYIDGKPKGSQIDIEINSSSPQDLIDKGFLEIEAQLKHELLEKLKSIDPYYFEKVILILLKKMGYGDFVETPKSGDGGIDGIINEDKLGLDKIYIQAKKYVENKVREKDIRDFIGAMSGDTSKGVFVTTSDFDKAAIQKAHDAHHTIILIDGKKLVELMLQNNVGVQNKFTYEVKELDDDFFEGE
jgi:restriction system protein